MASTMNAKKSIVMTSYGKCLLISFSAYQWQQLLKIMFSACTVDCLLKSILWITYEALIEFKTFPTAGLYAIFCGQILLKTVKMASALHQGELDFAGVRT